MGVTGQHHATAALYPGERTPGTHFDRVGLRVGLDTEATGKILCLCRGLNPDHPVVLVVTVLYCIEQQRPHDNHLWAEENPHHSTVINT
jgi:hypothetical protein